MQGCEDSIQTTKRESEGIQQERCTVLQQHFSKNEQIEACWVWCRLQNQIANSQSYSILKRTLLEIRQCNYRFLQKSGGKQEAEPMIIDSKT